MNRISLDRQRQIVRMAVEGNSIRSIERMTGTHRDTVMRHLLRVGRHCAELFDDHVRDVHCQYLQCDEIWCYVGKKEKRVLPEDPDEFGDAYTFVGMDQDTKLVISFVVGKRDAHHADKFLADLAERVIGRMQISTDGWSSYPAAIRRNLKGRTDYGQIIKVYGGTTTDGAQRYSPPGIIHAFKERQWGRPKGRYICTSHVERQNLTMRMQMRRFTRLTNAFSKRVENLRAAVALHFVWYNFVRRHRGLGGITPAMQAGLESSAWTFEQLLPEW